jgi:hypothetical protein
MSNVLNRITKQYLKSVNTPNYPLTEWIHNPLLPNCDKKFMVIEGNIIREMTTIEKVELAYSTESTVYLITEKQLKINVNAHDYEGNSNAIINPAMPARDIKYIKVVDEKIVEMTAEEKAVVDLPETERIESRTSLKEAYTNAISQLQNIQNTSAPTSAQVIAAVKHMAVIQEKLLKYIYRNI